MVEYRPPTSEEKLRAARVGRMALELTDDSLTMYGAEGAAFLRILKDPAVSDVEMAADIASHYKPREGALQRYLF